MKWELYTLNPVGRISSAFLWVGLIIELGDIRTLLKGLIRLFFKKKAEIDFHTALRLVKRLGGLEVGKVDDGYRVYWPEGDYITVKNLAELRFALTAYNLSFKAVDVEISRDCIKALNNKCIIFARDYIENDGIRLTRRSIEGCDICLIETFITRIHDVLQPRDKVVADIGAWVGDSSLRFAKLGAKKVVAFEPNPYNYVEFIKNLKLNPHLRDKIIPVNAAIGKDGTYRLCFDKILTGGGALSLYSKKNTQNCVNVTCYSINSIIEKYGMFDVLKMDCKGCEIDVLKELRMISVRPSVIKFEIDLGKWGHIINYDFRTVFRHLRSLGYRFQAYRSTPQAGLAIGLEVLAWK